MGFTEKVAFLIRWVLLPGLAAWGPPTQGPQRPWGPQHWQELHALWDWFDQNPKLSRGGRRDSWLGDHSR